MQRRVLACVLAYVLASLLAACAATQRGPSRVLPLPDTRAARARLFQALGARAFAVLRGADPAALMLDDDALRTLLEPEAAGRAALVRASTPVRVEDDAHLLVDGARYLGLCVQHARLEPAGPPLGLRSEAFAFDRALVVGLEPGGGRVAAWVEGSFVLTDRGFYAVALQRFESPRRDHADLDLAACDLRFGLDPPPGVVVPGADSY